MAPNTSNQDMRGGHQDRGQETERTHKDQDKKQTVNKDQKTSLKTLQPPRRPHETRGARKRCRSRQGPEAEGDQEYLSTITKYYFTPLSRTSLSHQLTGSKTIRPTERNELLSVTVNLLLALNTVFKTTNHSADSEYVCVMLFQRPKDQIKDKNSTWYIPEVVPLLKQRIWNPGKL